ncbi:MAG TPA: tyrosine-protein phosphatase [Syntrophales bacterium]|nr:tyrosine-protein phosphatase [Syntrophales bacterium]HPI57465.1 tyrosine-protein phosphatase [Syntrophales bacterium]HPN25678.1 tyrosine-protein phosphatase [Syntrophales bacterium]HQM29490.1 tyrosine-protein phosphatase [Syntrophales bacterium]
MKNKCSCGRIVKRFRPVFLLLVGISFLLGGCQTIKQLLYSHDSLNFYTVEKDALYRSAQPTGVDLETIVKTYGIESVLNLRGKSPGQNWYDNELIVSEDCGLKRTDISMSAGRLPHRSEVLSLLDAYRDLPRPILVHCMAGADRTGLAAAVFAFDYMKLSKKEASRQLDVYYGHVPDMYPAMTEFFNIIYQGETWARESYDPCKVDTLHYDKVKYCGAPPEPDLSEAVRPAPAPPVPPSAALPPSTVKRRIDDER